MFSGCRLRNQRTTAPKVVGIPHNRTARRWTIKQASKTFSGVPPKSSGCSDGHLAGIAIIDNDTACQLAATKSKLFSCAYRLCERLGGAGTHTQPVTQSD